MEEVAYARYDVRATNFIRSINPYPNNTSNTYKSFLSNGQEVYIYMGNRVEDVLLQAEIDIIGWTSSVFPKF